MFNPKTSPLFLGEHIVKEGNFFYSEVQYSETEDKGSAEHKDYSDGSEFVTAKTRSDIDGEEGSLSTLESLSIISADFAYLTGLTASKSSFDFSKMATSEMDYVGPTEIGPEFLIWNNPSPPSTPLYPENSRAPFIILLESTVKSLNVGKLNPIAIAIMIGNLIEGEKTISKSGQNQIKIKCTNRADANILLTSQELREKNYKAYIPNSITQQRALIREVGPEFSVQFLVDLIPHDTIKNLISIKRRVNFDQQITDTLEFTFFGQFLPEVVRIKDFEFSLTPIVPRPTRCFRCQIYRHISSQCRTSHPNCEYCSEAHNSQECPNQLRRPRCVNCRGSHCASSLTCPVYIKEERVRKTRAEQSCGYREAECILGLSPYRRRMEVRSPSIQSDEAVNEHSGIAEESQTAEPDQHTEKTHNTKNDQDIEEIPMDLSTSSSAHSCNTSLNHEEDANDSYANHTVISVNNRSASDSSTPKSMTPRAFSTPPDAQTDRINSVPGLNERITSRHPPAGDTLLYKGDVSSQIGGSWMTQSSTSHATGSPEGNQSQAKKMCLDHDSSL